MHWFHYDSTNSASLSQRDPCRTELRFALLIIKAKSYRLTANSQFSRLHGSTIYQKNLLYSGNIAIPTKKIPRPHDRRICYERKNIP